MPAKKKPVKKKKESVARKIRRIRKALAAGSKAKSSAKKRGWAKADYLAFAKYPFSNWNKTPFSKFNKIPFKQFDQFLNFVKRVP